MKTKARRHEGTGARSGNGRDRRIVDGVCRWFENNARELPWREVGPDGRRDGYRSLVSEFMLQQTQVSRVLEKFGPFMTRFPTAGALAAADEKDVLAHWSGLGYYRRARLLHGAARGVAERFGGRVPEDAGELRTLPGVGRYTAGAVASIVYGRAEAIVDGNVARVLMRVEGREMEAEQVWDRAGALVRASERPGVFNEGLMELGATVCVPRGPRCGECPLARVCRALAEGTADQIPKPKVKVARKAVFCASVVLEDGRGRVLVERRGDKGMWAGLWQAPTLEGPRRASLPSVEGWIGVEGLTRGERFAHGTTHRAVEFQVWRGRGERGMARDGREWVSRREVAGRGLSNAQRRVLLGADE